MNCFILDENPKIAAQFLCDQHVIKMIVESAQMLANCFTLEQLELAPKTATGKIRGYSYLHHPCSKWVLSSKANAGWLLTHVQEMLAEKYKRYPNGSRHATHDFIDWVEQNIDEANIFDGELTEFPIAISLDKRCRIVDSFDRLSRVEQYRLYYIHDKPFATWKLNKPEWYE